MVVEIDIDARRLSSVGAAAIAEVFPRLEDVTLRNGYNWPGIGCLTTAVTQASKRSSLRPSGSDSTPILAPFPRPTENVTARQSTDACSLEGSVTRTTTACDSSTSSLQQNHQQHQHQHQHQRGHLLQSSSKLSSSAPSAVVPVPTVEESKGGTVEGGKSPLLTLLKPESIPDTHYGSSYQREGDCSLSLRSLSLSGLGRAVKGRQSGDDPHPDQFEEWALLAEACAPTLRSLKLTKFDWIPLCALTPFFKYPSTRTRTPTNAMLNASSQHVSSVSTPAKVAGAAADGDNIEGGSRSMKNGEEYVGLVELMLDTVCPDLACTLLRGVEWPTHPKLRQGRVGGACFSSGGVPRPPLVGLRCLTLVVKNVTDSLCSAIAEGCPNIREVGGGKCRNIYN